MIIISVNELARGSFYMRMMLKSGLRVFDPTVAILNQIMYTFHRETQYVYNNGTRQQWYWTTNTFKNLNPLLKYDYNDRLMVLLVNEIFAKGLKCLWIIFIFMCISLINAVFIRVSLKSSVIMLFPMIAL